MNIPRVRPYPADAAQCDSCGGHGCAGCEWQGWVSPYDPLARQCERRGCRKLITPDNPAVYCSNECAVADA
jgi:hypothetical protein